MQSSQVAPTTCRVSLLPDSFNSVQKNLFAFMARSVHCKAIRCIKLKQLLGLKGERWHLQVTQVTQLCPVAQGPFSSPKPQEPFQLDRTHVASWQTNTLRSSTSTGYRCRTVHQWFCSFSSSPRLEKQDFVPLLGTAVRRNKHQENKNKLV